MGKDGIDSGAMSKEFLTQAILDMSIPPTMYRMDISIPVDKLLLWVLGQGGPPPWFLEECVYETLVNPIADCI